MNRGTKNPFDTPGKEPLIVSSKKKNTMNRSMGEEEMKENIVESDRISENTVLSAR